MENENRNFTVIDADGNEKEMCILFTYTDEETNKNYVFYYDPEAEEKETFVSAYDEEGTLFAVEEDSEWDKLEEVFESFLKDSEHECGCGHHHKHGDGECCCSHHDDEECDCDDDDCCHDDGCCCHNEK